MFQKTDKQQKWAVASCALLAYRREIEDADQLPVIQTNTRKRLTPNGLRSVLLRIGKRAGIQITPHAIRRTFATLSLRSGMKLLQLYSLMGHSV